mmetsp:Transcript_3390/g.8399  ORF Transcript_3390/g.8399 Transcript_3390/m.8399 type:complete len:335 (+) Transcript_3390:57-1061(+)
MGAAKEKGGAPSSAVKDAMSNLAEELLTRNLVESRPAIEGRERVEIFRGQDLLAYLSEHPEAVAKALPNAAKNSSSAAEQAKTLATLMLKRGLFTRSERLFKKPKPGKQRLTKFPRKVFYCQDQAFAEGAFFTWKVQRPATPWVAVGSYLLVLLVIACCLFPLAPFKVKQGVFYTSLTMLSAIFAIVGFRCAVYALIWTVAGKYVWIVPNLFADNVPITEVFSPFVEEERNKHGKPYPAPALSKRIVAVAGLLYLLWFSYRNTPEKGYGAKLRSSSDNLFDYLLEHGSLNRRIQDDSANTGGGDEAAKDSDAEFAEAVIQEEAGGDGGDGHDEL